MASYSGCCSWQWAEADAEYAQATVLLGDAAKMRLTIAHAPGTPLDVLPCNQPPPRIEAFAQPPPGGRYGLPITAQRYTSVVGVSVICWAFAAARIGYR